MLDPNPAVDITLWLGSLCPQFHLQAIHFRVKFEKGYINSAIVLGNKFSP